MTKEEAVKYINYPEGSLSKRTYDSFFMPFDEFLIKYYKNPDLKRWYYINDKFVNPLFDGTSWENYQDFLSKVKPQFVPIESKIQPFFYVIKNDERFDKELKFFFNFLYSINFYGEFSFEEWLNIKNWMHPWFEDEQNVEKSIIEILKNEYSENYLKEQFASLSIF
ncbi:MAG: hypothetical protein ACK50L_08215 [Bacteroidota bacterium]